MLPNGQEGSQGGRNVSETKGHLAAFDMPPPFVMPAHTDGHVHLNTSDEEEAQLGLVSRSEARVLGMRAPRRRRRTHAFHMGRWTRQVLRSGLGLLICSICGFRLDGTGAPRCLR